MDFTIWLLRPVRRTGPTLVGDSERIVIRDKWVGTARRAVRALRVSIANRSPQGSFNKSKSGQVPDRC